MTTLGARLRHLRSERGCTLQQVSSGSGLTPSFLSRLERGIVNISVGNLRKVADFFGVPITYFFREEKVPPAVVVRAGQRPRSVPGDGVMLEDLLPRQTAGLGAVVVTMGPGQAQQALLDRSSWTLYYVLSGELTCSLGGQAHQLAAGDVLFQRRPAPLHWSNPRGPAVVLVASWQAEEA